MTLKVTDNQYGVGYPCDSWAFCLHGLQYIVNFCKRLNTCHANVGSWDPYFGTAGVCSGSTEKVLYTVSQ